MKRILCAALVMGLLMQPIVSHGETLDPQPTALNSADTQSENSLAETNTIILDAPEATPTPSVEETATPPAEATPTPSVEATPTPAAEATPVPPANDAPIPPEPTQAPNEPTDDDALTVSTKTEIPETAQAWILSGEAYVCGSLSAVLKRAEAGAEVWLRRLETMEAPSVSLKHMASLQFKRDEAAFAEGEYRICISRESPETTDAPTLLDLSAWLEAEADETANLYLWVEKQESAEQNPPAPEPPSESDVKISVQCEAYRAGEWSSVHPEFLLSGIPEDKNWVYAAVIYDERIAVLSGNSYLAEDEGVYTLRFVILDEMGDIVDASEKYTLWLDHTLPEVSINMDYERDYTLYIDMADGMSGLSGLSLDGGVSWMELNGAESASHTVCEKTRFAAGMIQVRDAAGNTYCSTESYTLAAIPKDNFSYGGGSGGSDEKKNEKPHAKAEQSEADTGAVYSGLTLEISEEPMHTLTIGDDCLELTLELVSAEGFEIPEEYAPCFTAELAPWATQAPLAQADTDDEEAEQEPDTLLLTAVEEENLGDRFEYRWRFNGEVYRLLANSGIRYLALQIGEDMAVFPTEGFAGGTKYTELKMLGVSTKKFDYTVAMSFNLDPDRIPKLSDCDFSENCDMAVQVAVENAKYVLGDVPKGEMYYYNVYLGPIQMMDLPYGVYGAQSAADEAE